MTVTDIIRSLAGRRRTHQRLQGFRRDESGTSTVEFVLFVPFFLILFLSSFETGMLMARNAMLDRGLDIAIRDVRLGTLAVVTHDNVVETVCESAVIIPDCQDKLRLEMRPLDPRDWDNIGTTVDCVDVEDDSQPVREFVAGQPNRLMIIRACALAEPIAPNAGIGAGLQRVSGDNYAITATAAYVVEP